MECTHKFDINEYIHGKARQKILDSVEWNFMPSMVVCTGFFDLSVDGTKMEFFINVYPRYMEVSLMVDGKLIKNECELDSSSLAIFTESLYENRVISEYGIKTAKLLAFDLYHKSCCK